MKGVFGEGNRCDVRPVNGGTIVRLWDFLFLALT